MDYMSELNWFDLITFDRKHIMSDMSFIYILIQYNINIQ